MRKRESKTGAKSGEPFVHAKKQTSSEQTLTAEQIQKKIDELVALQQLIDPNYKSKGEKRWKFPSFQSMYIFMELFLLLATFGLALYVYQTNSKHQAMLKEAVKHSQESAVANSEATLDVNAGVESTFYDKEEFCVGDDCDDITMSNVKVDDQELDNFLKT